MWRTGSAFSLAIRRYDQRRTTFVGCSRNTELGRQAPKCPSPHGRLCRIVRYSPLNGTENGIVRSGTGWYFGEGLTDLSCSTQSAHFASMSVPILVASSRNGSLL